MRDAPDRYPPYSAVARRTDRLAYAFLPGTADVGAVEQKLRTLGVAREQSPVGELLILHDLRLRGLEAAPPGLLFEALERLPLLDARLRIAAAYEAAGNADRANSTSRPARARHSGRLGGSRSPLVALSGRRSAREGRRAGCAARRAFTPARLREVSFGEAVRLLGYTLSRPTVRAGDRLELICFWSATGALDVDLHLTAQLSNGCDTSRELRSAGGRYGTTSWEPGEVVPVRMRSPSLGTSPGPILAPDQALGPTGIEPALRPRAEGHGSGSRWLTLTEIEIQPSSP